MIAAHLPHIAQLPERDVLWYYPSGEFFAEHDICSSLIENRVSLLR